MKFCVFTDLHYDAIPDGDRRIDELMQNCKKSKVDFIIELGDLCNPTKENEKILDRFRESGLPCYFSIGNHNTDFCSPETVLRFFWIEAWILFCCQG
ncbi:MAG: metallophosphoesterase [Bacillota bacterium]|nr:metallophosphoesterase [Bacillota bacterium]